MGRMTSHIKWKIKVMFATTRFVPDLSVALPWSSDGSPLFGPSNLRDENTREPSIVPGNRKARNGFRRTSHPRGAMGEHPLINHLQSVKIPRHSNAPCVKHQSKGIRPAILLSERTVQMAQRFFHDLRKPSSTYLKRH